MLQPDNYPKMIAQALVLEPEPFIEMADDDNPWIEGLFLTTVVGFLIGLARVIGGFLFSRSMPDSDALLEAVIQSLEQLAPGGSAGEGFVVVEQRIRGFWPSLTTLLAYGDGGERLLLLVLTPLALILTWVLFGLLAHGSARLLGGGGSLNQSLGVISLVISPFSLLLLTAIPFVAVPVLLVPVWSTLVAYRGIEVAHDLGPGRAAAVIFLSVALLSLLLSFGIFAAIGLGSMGRSWIGGAL